MHPNPHLLAQSTNLGTITGIGNIGTITGYAQGVSTFTSVISKVIGFLTLIGFLWFMFQFFIGAIAWISAGNDKQNMQNAKKRILNSILGLLITVLSYLLIALVSYFMGVDFLNFGALLDQIATT